MPKCILEIGPSPRAQPLPTPANVRLQTQPWNQAATVQMYPLPDSTGQSMVLGWRGEEEASYYINPSYLPTTNGLFSAPNGFCLTNGVSFLQRYDPGLVVVMVNLAVVIFYFQTELLLLSSVHQYVRLTFSVVAIILLLGLSFSFPFLSLCTLVWSLFIKGYC